MTARFATTYGQSYSGRQYGYVPLGRHLVILRSISSLNNKYDLSDRRQTVTFRFPLDAASVMFHRI